MLKHWGNSNGLFCGLLPIGIDYTDIWFDRVGWSRMQTRHLLVETIPQMFSALQKKMGYTYLHYWCFCHLLFVILLKTICRVNGLALSYTVVQHKWRQGWYPVFLLGCNCRTLRQGPNRHYSCNSHCTPVLHCTCTSGGTIDHVFYKILSKMFWSLSLEKTTSSAYIHECI